MMPDAIYYFDRISEYKTRYIQIDHKGKKIPNFPSVYKGGKYKRERYIVFRKTSGYYNQGHLRFTHALELAKSQIITKFAFLPEYPRQSYGGYKKYGVLIEFSECFDKLKIWFFRGMQEAAPHLFQKRQAGGIPEVVKKNAMFLRYGIHR